MRQRINPEIQGVYRVDPIEVLVGVRNPVAAGSPYLDQTLLDRASIETLGYVDHRRRNIDTSHESSPGEFRCACERVAVAKTDFQHPGLLVELQKFERSSIWSCCLKRHYARDHASEKSGRMRRLPSDEFRTAQEALSPSLE